MVYRPFVKRKCGRQPERCDRCKKQFNIGDVYYTKYVKAQAREHICVECYEKLFYPTKT